MKIRTKKMSIIFLRKRNTFLFSFFFTVCRIETRSRNSFWSELVTFKHRTETRSGKKTFKNFYFHAVEFSIEKMTYFFLFAEQQTKYLQPENYSENVSFVEDRQKAKFSEKITPAAKFISGVFFLFGFSELDV